MTLRGLATMLTVTAFTVGFAQPDLRARAFLPGVQKPAGQNGAPQTPAFKSGVDMVRVAAVVRDRKGRFVQDLTARDFELLESGKPKTIADFRTDVSGVSIAVLFDVSGS